MRGDAGGGGANEVMGGITCGEEGHGLKNDDGFTRSVEHVLAALGEEFEGTDNFRVEGNVTGAGADSESEVAGSEIRAVDDWFSCAEIAT